MTFLLNFLLFLLGACGVLKLYAKSRAKRCKSQICLHGKTAIVTGANCGIGYETALDFAKRGAKVLLACRNKYKAEEARLKIIEETDNKNVFVKIVDMASFESVRAFAKEINETEDRLDILVNNAGAYGIGDKRTIDGLPLLMQVNYFSSVLLTRLLIKLLKKTTSSRIINVSSLAAYYDYKLDVNNLDKCPPNNTDYYHSKLCNVLFTIELAKKLEGTGVTTFSLHPGFVSTDIFHNLRGLKKTLFSVLVKFLSITCEEGAQTSIYCSVAKGIEKYSGEHFDACEKVERYKTASNPQLAKNLWKKTEELIQLKLEEREI